LQEDTRYYYIVQAYNTAGFAQSNEANALTESSPVDGYVNEVVAGSSRVRKFTTVVVGPPPVAVTPRPLIKFGFQAVATIQSDWILWEHKTTGERRTFPQMEQNNNPTAQRPDSNWQVVTINNFTNYVQRVAAAGCNLLGIWIATPLLQTSATTYHFDIVGYMMEYAGSYGVYLSIGIKNSIGNGGHPDRIGLGYDQSATWRYLLEDCCKSQQFNDETGTLPARLGFIIFGRPSLSSSFNTVSSLSIAPCSPCDVAIIASIYSAKLLLYPISAMPCRVGKYAASCRLSFFLQYPPRQRLVDSLPPTEKPNQSTLPRSNHSLPHRPHFPPMPQKPTP